MVVSAAVGESNAPLSTAVPEDDCRPGEEK